MKRQATAAADAFYPTGSRDLQDRFDARRIADRLVEVTLNDQIDDWMRGFLESRDMFFLATTDEHGQPTCSYKGGDPGFLRVLDAKTIAWPNYDGNGMFLSMGNVKDTKKVGLLFVDFEHPNRVRIHGTASISYDDPLLKEFPEAQFLVKVEVEKVFPNCPRYVHQYKLVKHSAFVPREGCTTPVPGWKRAPWAHDALPKNDPASAT